MYICQYYAATQANKDKIIALAELLGCQYRTAENIIAVEVDDDETLGRLDRCELMPCAVQRGDCSAAHSSNLFSIKLDSLSFISKLN